MSWLVRALSPGSAPAKNLGMIIPGAQLRLFPFEVIAHAEPPASHTGDEPNGRPRERVCYLCGKIFRVENAAVVERLGKWRVPTDPSQELQVADGCDDGMLVIGRKSAVDPIEEPGERNANVLPGIADGNAQRGPSERNETYRYLAACCGPQGIDDGQGARADADDEYLGLAW